MVVPYGRLPSTRRAPDVADGDAGEGDASGELSKAPAPSRPARGWQETCKEPLLALVQQPRAEPGRRAVPTQRARQGHQRSRGRFGFPAGEGCTPSCHLSASGSARKRIGGRARSSRRRRQQKPGARRSRRALERETYTCRACAARCNERAKPTWLWCDYCDIFGVCPAPNWYASTGCRNSDVSGGNKIVQSWCSRHLAAT